MPHSSPSPHPSQSSSPTQSPLRTKAPKPRAPAKGSLRDILIRNQRQRLYLPPELWTMLHLRLLDCRYIVSPIPTTSTISKLPPESILQEQPQSQVQDADKRNALLARRLGQHSSCRSAIQLLLYQLGPAFSRLSTQKDRVIRSLFPVLVCAAQESMKSRRSFDLIAEPISLALSFNQKVVAQVYVPWLVRHRRSRASPYAFIDETWMRDDEGEYFEARRSRAFRKQSRASPDPALPIDPYYVAILLALAQDVGRVDQSWGKRTGKGVTSIPIRLFTPAPKRDYLRCYTLHHTTPILRKFNFPYEHINAPVEITATEFRLEPPLEVIDLLEQTLHDVNQMMVRAQAPTSSQRTPGSCTLAPIENGAERIPREEAKDKADLRDTRPLKRKTRAEIDIGLAPVSCLQVKTSTGLNVHKRSKVE